MVITTRTTRRVRILVALIVGLVMSAPLLYMLAGSLMSNSQLSIQPPQVIPSSFHFANYPAAFSGMTQVIQVRSFVNSVVFTVGAVGLQWVLCISGGLVIAKMHFRSRGLITVLFAISLFIPLLTTLIPTFVVTYKLGLINTYPGLILPIAAQTGFGSLLFRQYIKQLPEELFDAARLDGANWWLMLRRLVIPLARPATAAYLAISVLTAWNMYLWPLVAAEGGSLQVLTQTLATVGSSAQGQVTPQNVIFASVVIVTLPMIIVFLAVQPAFIRGLAGSGVE
ncbi:MAG: carbohydrate ABC transporter permease [Acidimicrobiales bacterium]|jgi:ABC-type glycerol-3-phosphate transport system permease component